MFVVFVRPGCPYCAEAIALLTEQKVLYGLVDVNTRPGIRDRLKLATDCDTVPSVWYGGVYLGGLNTGPASFGGLRAVLRRDTGLTGLGGLTGLRRHPDFGRPVPA